MAWAFHWSGRLHARPRPVRLLQHRAQDALQRAPARWSASASRNFDPRFSKADDTNSPRPHYVNLRVQDLGEPLRIDLNEFTVPEWWIMQMKHPREYNRARLDNAIQIAVDVPDDLTNKTYEMEIEHLVLHGEWVSREQTYLAILVAWLLGASLLSMHRSVQLRQRSRSQQREIDALMTRTRELRVAGTSCAALPPWTS